MTCGKIFAAACAQLEASIAEQAAELCGGSAGVRESFAGGSCAELGCDAARHRNKQGKTILAMRIGLLPVIPEFRRFTSAASRASWRGVV